MLGVSPAFVMACRKEGLEPGAAVRPLLDPHDRRAGSPLPLEGFEWLYGQLGPEVLLNLGSGGTDVCTRDRPGLPAAAGLRGRDVGALPGRRRAGVRP